MRFRTTVDLRSISRIQKVHIVTNEVFKLILKRLAINCLGVYLFNTGLQYVPLSIANSLFNTSPIMVFFI